LRETFGAGEHHAHFINAVETGPSGFEHMRHISQRLPDLLCNRRSGP
jgi:hypothetical protein